MDFKHFSFLEQNIKKQKGGVIPLLGVSLIIFIVTVAVYFVANYVSEGIAKQGMLSAGSICIRRRREPCRTLICACTTPRIRLLRTAA